MRNLVPARILTGVHQIWVDTAERFDRLNCFSERLENAWGFKDWWRLAEEKEEEGGPDELGGNLVNFGLDLEKKKMKEKVLDQDDLGS
ncbi:hypothetical protein PanWU01x14_227490 [Parasponia andersonii]|uniref:Uncharacterized protein n=1 Tax=Parasponia andersonii TaxID=3476 RepID=A0A2P5BM69_PARAD|nr:hypothetical protein PanWU01x14_227490 [Parasponia andersonii]